MKKFFENPLFFYLFVFLIVLTIFIVKEYKDLQQSKVDLEKQKLEIHAEINKEKSKKIDRVLEKLPEFGKTSK